MRFGGTHSDLSDHELVRRMLAGDESAFDGFFAGHFPPLYRFALARLRGDADAAEEVVQVTLCRAVRKLHTWRGEAALLTWLCTICRREIAAATRKRGLGEAVGLFEDSPEVRAALESLGGVEAGQPERDLLRGELAHLVRLTLDNLSPRYANALEWKYVEGASVREIAERMEVGEKAAESVLTRAREAFRKAFTTLCEGLGEPAWAGDAPGRSRW